MKKLFVTGTGAGIGGGAVGARDTLSLQQSHPPGYVFLDPMGPETDFRFVLVIQQFKELLKEVYCTVL